MKKTFTVPDKMTAVLLTGHGGLDKLEYRNDVPVPQPGPSEVLIRVGEARSGAGVGRRSSDRPK